MPGWRDLLPLFVLLLPTWALAGTGAVLPAAGASPPAAGGGAVEFPGEPVAARAELARRIAQTAQGDATLPLAVDLTQRPFGVDAYRKLFLAMWAQVPNWKSGDPLWIKRAEPLPSPRVPGQPRPKRLPPHEPEKLDWFEALLALDLAELEQPFVFDGLPKVELPPVAPAEREALRRDALAVVAQMKALAATHRADAVEPLFRLAFVLDGVFRDECGRQIRAIGEAAVAPLVRLQYARGQAGAPLTKQRRYAVYQLDRMDRARPSKALATAPDDRLRAELLKAYGEARALDAVEPVLEQVNAQSHRVRREARLAFRRYVEGPPPAPAPRRKRKLPGGRAETEEKPDYLTYREVAELALARRLSELGITLSEAHPSALTMFEAIVAHDDAERAAEWERAFRSAREHADAGDIDAALAEYEGILAHDPTTTRRAEMAPAFARAAALRRKSGKLDEAAALAWKAVALAAATDAPRYEAEASFLDAERAASQGRVDEAALRRTVTLAPDHLDARARLVEIDRARERETRRRSLAATGVVAALFLLGLWLLRRARPRVRHRDRPSTAGP